ncbi:MAG: DUF1294 domain-containing protein [Bacteroidaceae bacterium]|nr:DUF1294 domain-containing protein [Bacteroidaceae bacterium]
MRLLLCYLLAINLLAFILYGIDKYKAKHKRWRIPEVVLLWLAVLGGSPAALVAMHLFHHKTLHKKFRYGVPAILLLQLAAAVYYWYTSMV